VFTVPRSTPEINGSEGKNIETNVVREDVRGSGDCRRSQGYFTVAIRRVENLKLLTGALGYRLFEPLVAHTVTTADEYLINAARGANARGILTNDGMVVRGGSEAAISVVPSTPEAIVSLRERLIQQGVIVSENSKFVFSRDHLFASPSTAAAVVMGRNANGRIEWKDAQGRTIKDNEE
jgi:hypothetical protein